MASSSSTTSGAAPTSLSLSEEDSIRLQKQTLRKQLRTRLKDLSMDEITQQSYDVYQRLIQLESYNNAKSIAIFLSMPTCEINTDPIIAHAVRHQKTIYVPQVGANFDLPDMEMIQVPQNQILYPHDNDKSPNDEDDDPSKYLFHKKWPKNKWGIPEPPPPTSSESSSYHIAQPGDIDVIIVPGLGFDRHGHRLGQGKGYYDRFLSRMMKTTSQPILIAIALTCQCLDQPHTIPVHELDVSMDWIVLPNETIQVVDASGGESSNSTVPSDK